MWMTTAQFHKLTSLSGSNTAYTTNIKNREPLLLYGFIWQARQCVLQSNDCLLVKNGRKATMALYKVM
jgi:hypothetical protein